MCILYVPDESSAAATLDHATRFAPSLCGLNAFLEPRSVGDQPSVILTLRDEAIYHVRGGRNIAKDIRLEPEGLPLEISSLRNRRG